MVIGNYLIVKTWGLLEKRFADSKQLVVKSYSQVPDKDLQPRVPLFFSRFFTCRSLQIRGIFLHAECRMTCFQCVAEVVPV